MMSPGFSSRSPELTNLITTGESWMPVTEEKISSLNDKNISSK